MGHRSSLLQCGEVAFRQAEFAGAQQAAHDLAAAGLGQVVAEDDLVRCHGRDRAVGGREPSARARVRTGL